MTETEIPVVPLDQAPLSDRIIAYLAELRGATGRYICFWDARDIRRVDSTFPPHVKARAIAEPDKPFLAIVADMGEISRANYLSHQHDHIFAHEAGHLRLWVDGYRPLEYADQPVSARWALDAVSNWLADPIINCQIHSQGFDMSADRAREITESTLALGKGIWRRKASEPSIRLAVSFLLEPNIPVSLTSAFSNAVYKGLAPADTKVVMELVEAIKQEEISSPESHDAAVVRCFNVLNDNLGLALRPPKFVPRYKCFSKRQMRRWASSEVKSTKEWP